MKVSKSEVQGKATPITNIRFEEQRLTSFAGLVVFQRFFAQLGLKDRLRGCFEHLGSSAIYNHHVIMLLLVVHLLLGYRELRDVRYYRDDEMVKRLLGLKQLPEVSTVSRRLADADLRSVEAVRSQNRQLVLDRAVKLKLARVTVDFDGSVLSTKRRAEGAAVGFNKVKKGQRSYYPLYATIAQSGQVLDMLHRSGNVHDSNGAPEFISQCLAQVRQRLPQAKLETRVDSAFFSEAVIDKLAQGGVEFTASVPFERFGQLKTLIEQRQRWRRIDDELSYFESSWKPKSWQRPYRFLFIRKRVRQQQKQPLQLDLFVPYQYGYEFKVIVTNKRLRAKNVVSFHEGRGSQEAVFGELKTDCQMGHVAVTTRIGNQLYLFAAILAHNLTRELQMQAAPAQRLTNAKRAALWPFKQLSTLRRNLLQRAGRLIRPQGKLVLSMSANPAVEQELRHYLDAFEPAA